MPLLPSAVDDFVNLTLSQRVTGKFVDLSMPYTRYIADRILQKHKVVERGGPDIRFPVQIKNTGLARATGLFAQDVTGVEDLTTEGVLEWRAITCNWSYDVFEPLFQSDRETIVSELVIRDHSCMNDLIELRERQLWGQPTSDSDTEGVAGIPAWLQTATTTAAGAFDGGNPSWSSVGLARLSSTTYTAWKNWTFAYDNVDENDFVKKVKKALYSTDFVAPHPHPEFAYGKSQYHMFGTYETRASLERLAETRNDNLGKDVARYINEVTVAGVPFEAVPYLDANMSHGEVYGVNWGVFRPYIKKGADMVQTKKNAPLQRNVREIHYDTWYNYACINRRKCFTGRTNA